MERQHIEFFRHSLGEEEQAAVAETLQSLFLTTGPKTAEFEKRFAEYLQAPAVVAVTSCTAALHLALVYHGVGPGDEVITTPMTFAATAAAVLMVGATPVFVDVDPDSGLITPEAVAAAVTERAKAVIPVHLYGRMADMKGLADVARQHGLTLIEDAAHAVESRRDGHRPGRLSHGACFSFYATKSLTCGEGGALVCGSEEEAAWYRSARHHGITKSAAERRDGPSFQHWDMIFPGLKYNPSDINTCLLTTQIPHLDHRREQRQRLVSLYRDLLIHIDGLTFMEDGGPDEIHAHHLCPVLLPPEVDRDRVAGLLMERGIGCAVNYRGVHRLTYFKETFETSPAQFPAADEIGRRTLSLPLYPSLTEEEVEVVCGELRDIINLLRGSL
jgi:dTDP-4-amino-4,6-dideoxygalactose transaminase